ncbi:MAG: hypothetical protein V7756_13800 [Halopseudomonas sp.]|uniref:hypothetical protein n=1 Tax=Halopseudomonas sp. TaxID=2901191 RepID=UPI003002B281
MNKLCRAALIAVLFLAGGCVTSELYKTREYTETLDAVMVSADEQWMVVLTPDHHYVFPLPEVVRKTFAAEFHDQVNASFEGFSVSSMQRVSGQYRFSIRRAREADRSAALAIGYHAEGDRLVFEGSVDGTRYPANGLRVDESMQTQALNRPYQIRVEESLRPHLLGLRTLVTPLAVMADGLLVIFSVPLVVVVGTDIAINGVQPFYKN